HPYLLYDYDDLQRLRQRAATDEEARRVIESITSRADGIIDQPPEIPQERTDDHRNMMGPIRAVGEAYALSGDGRYAAWVREAMLAYADLYSAMEPSGSRRTRIMGTDSGLYEATWYVPVICAYDMTCDSEVYSREDHARIERGLLRPAASTFMVADYDDPEDFRARDLHYKCYNFQAWFISAVGLTGLLLRDADLVEYAIDGPYGFKHLLKHDIHDDGIFWERSLGYHSFVLSALHPLLEAAWHCNLDLYRLEVADDHNEDREPLANYTVGDGDNGPKSIKLMFDGPLYALYGDRTYANIGDSGRGPHRFYDYYYPAWRTYRDPAYAWLYWQEHAQREALYGGAADLSATIRAARDDEHLYLCARITDDVVRNSHVDPAQVWAGDALWVGLKWRGDVAGAYDIIYGLSPGDFDEVLPVPAVFNRFGEVAHETSAGSYAAARTEDGYLLEFAIPWSELRPREGEQGAALQPAEGAEITADFVLYDCDAPDGETTKEKMLAWACTTDRYDSGQGGRLVLADAAPEGERAINAPRAEGLAPDGDPSDWDDVRAVAATIGPGSAVMTDSDAAGLDELLYGVPPRDAARLTYAGEEFCNNGLLEAGCSLYPSTGFAILRERLGESGFPPEDATCCTLNYGPHGGGHGHPDQLSIVLYADGKQWIPDFGSCPYGSDEKRQWTSQTISHNTVVVDEISQYPTGDSAPSWPCDSAQRQARGLLDAFSCDGVLKAAAARNTAVYDDAELRRTVAMVGDAVVDLFDVRGEAEHQYDYPLHIDGQLVESSTHLSLVEGTLGETCGYQHITSISRGSTEGVATTLWRDGDRLLRVTALAAGPTEVIVGEGITNALDRTMPVLILRRNATRTVFATVMQPSVSDAPPEVEQVDAPNGAIAVRLRVPDGDALVVYNATGMPVSVDGLTVRGRLALRLTRPDGTADVREL
ncbi:MAG: heparinase II/III domain-containing protein, partial [Armatimonadota bacterium]